MNDRQELIKRLRKFSKNEIIDDVVRYGWGNVVEDMLFRLETKAIKELRDIQTKAFDDTKSAFSAYEKWQQDMVNTYGDGKSVKMMNIPISELEKGAKLEKSMKKALDNENRITKKLNSLY